MKLLVLITLLSLSSLKVFAAETLYFTSGGQEIGVLITGNIHNPSGISFDVNCDKSYCNDSNFHKKIMNDFFTAIFRRAVYSYKFVYQCPIRDPHCDSMQSIKDPANNDIASKQIVILENEDIIASLEPSDRYYAEMAKGRSRVPDSTTTAYKNGLATQAGINSANGLSNYVMSNEKVASKFSIHHNKNGKITSIARYTGKGNLNDESIIVINKDDGGVIVEATFPNTLAGSTMAPALLQSLYNFGGISGGNIAKFIGTWKCKKVEVAIRHYSEVTTIICGYWP